MSVQVIGVVIPPGSSSSPDYDHGTSGVLRNAIDHLCADHAVPARTTLLDQVVAWSTALTPLRAATAAA